MIGNGPLRGFKVPGSRVVDIRQAADNVRNILDVGDFPQDLNMGLFLDRLGKYGISYDVLESKDMPHVDVEACWEPESFTMYVRSDVYEKACWKDPRACFTVMHELGHCLLGHRRTINRAENSIPPKTFEDSEWQANQFAAEFLMPLNVIREFKLNSAAKIAIHFNASSQAAEIRANQLSKRGELPC